MVCSIIPFQTDPFQDKLELDRLRIASHFHSMFQFARMRGIVKI